MTHDRNHLIHNPGGVPQQSKGCNGALPLCASVRNPGGVPQQSEGLPSGARLPWKGLRVSVLTKATHNPGGVSQQSEGLRVSALPWIDRNNDAQPRRGCLFPRLHRAKWATLPGLMIFSSTASRVARIRATLRFVGKPLRGFHSAASFAGKPLWVCKPMFDALRQTFHSISNSARTACQIAVQPLVALLIPMFYALRKTFNLGCNCARTACTIQMFTHCVNISTPFQILHALREELNRRLFTSRAFGVLGGIPHG